MQPIKFKAYGKINLYLAVGEKRADGFHEVETVMQKATVYDTVTVTPTEEKGIRLTSDSVFFPCDETNLIYKASFKCFRVYPASALPPPIPPAMGIRFSTCTAYP